MKEYVEWLGPLLRRRYESSLVKPANWRLIDELANLDEQAEEEAAKAIKEVNKEAKKPQHP